MVNVADKCLLLEEIECSYHKRPADYYRDVGNVRPELKLLRIHVEEWYDSYRDVGNVGNEEFKNQLRVAAYS